MVNDPARTFHFFFYPEEHPNFEDRIRADPGGALSGLAFVFQGRLPPGAILALELAADEFNSRLAARGAPVG
jgi:hypothetical protein